MSDVFLDPKVLNYADDKYELILLTLRWARQLKAKGSPEPMANLVNTALKDIVDGKVTKEEILASKVPMPEPSSDLPDVVSVADEGNEKGPRPLPLDDDEDSKGKKKAKKKAKDAE